MQFCQRFALLGCALAIDAAAALSCKSDSGSDVDFAYAFKYPNGWDYAYMDSDNELAKSKHQLNSATSSVSKTLAQMKGASYVLWNDQPPPSKKTSGPKAHSKGVIIFDSSEAIWLTHSLPDFPSTGEGMWKDGSHQMGQSFLCITLDAEELHKLSPVMLINEPVVYAHKFASGMEEKFKDVKAWAVDGEKNKDDMTAHVTIKSKGGQSFQLFGKSGLWGDGQDLYRDLVAPAVGDLLVEAWRRGHGPWGPACGKHKVLDVSHVSFPGQEWNTMTDHSKWAVGMTKKVFCVGDINRMDGQDGRGGGTVCISEASFADQMKKVITAEDKCGGEIIQV